MKVSVRWRPSVSAVVCTLFLLPAVVQAQVIAGSAAWSVGRGSSVSDGQPAHDNSFSQDYTLGYTGSLFDPRLLKYHAEVTFGTNGLSAGGVDRSQQGHQQGLGYKLGASLFPARPFPLFVQASRDTIDESGDYPSSSGIRGGIVVPAGTPLPGFRTRNSMFSAGWQLTLPSLPHVDIGYRKGMSVMTGGPYQAEQREEDLHLSVSKDTARTRQLLRFQRTAYENRVSQAFNQRLNNIEYEFGAAIPMSGRASVRAGRRTSLSLFDVAPHVIDADAGAYRPPSRGEVGTTYVESRFSIKPASRLTLDVSGTLDRQDASKVTTSARLAAASAHYEVLHGLSLFAAGTYGEREQALGSDTITVTTRSGMAGASYRARARWLEGSIGYSAGIGTNTTLDGLVGDTGRTSGQASLSASSRWLTLSGGYERTRNWDDILDYGNLDLERVHAALQGQVGRVVLNGSYEEALVDRGNGLTLARERQRSFTATASLRLSRDSRLAVNAGGFRNVREPGQDRNLFAGLSFEWQVSKAVHVTAWGRQGETTATQTRLDQRTLSVYSQLEYRLRFFNFAIEYRYNDQALSLGGMANPFSYRGHQMLLRIRRKFGFSL